MNERQCLELAAAVIARTLNDLEAFETLDPSSKPETLTTTRHNARDAAYCLKHGGLDEYMEILGHDKHKLAAVCRQKYPQALALLDRRTPCQIQ